MMAAMPSILRHFYIAVKAYWLKFFRTRATMQVFKDAHVLELRDAIPSMWPVIMARQAGEIRAVRAGQLDAGTVGTGMTERRSWQFPFLPASSQRLSMPLLKPTPYNLRRMSRTPIPRRAINLIKSGIISQPWDVVPIEGVEVKDEEDQAARCQIGRKMFNHPNNEDSFQTFAEKGLEDYLCFGAFCAELGLTVDPTRPLKMWPVNVESIRMFASWSEGMAETMPHYVQMTGLKGERGAVPFFDDELLYLKDNSATDTPFGMGKMEIAFATVNAFLGVQEMAGRAGSDQIHKTFLWWAHPQSESAYQIVRRYIQNDLEGQAKLSIIGGMQKPDVIDVNPVKPEDLLLEWQEMLIRVIASSFDMSAMALGVAHDVNRATAGIMDDKDFRTAILPAGQRLAEGFTRKILHAKLGWYDVEFKFLSIEDPDPQTKMDIAQRMYVVNSITPNEIRKGMRMKELATPFGDMTSIEMEMLMLDAQAAVAKANAPPPMLGPDGQPLPPGIGPDGQPLPPGAGGAPPFGAKPGMPGAKPAFGKKPGLPGQVGQGLQQSKQPDSKSPSGPSLSPAGQGAKALSKGGFGKPGGLKKFNAKAAAMMPVNQMADVMRIWGVGATEMAEQLDKEDPNMLSKLADETRAYLEEQIKKEVAEDKIRTTPETLKRIQERLVTKRGESNKRPKDYAEYLGKDRNVGKPGGLNDSAGKPGKLNNSKTYKGKTPV
jgi:hypothetical protein